MLTVPASTQEYINVPLTAWSGDVTDPTSLPVQVAIVATVGEPAETDYRDAAWVTDAGVHKARILWRTAVASPAPRTAYHVWLRITANPETPVMFAGTIRTR